jgi:regulator of Ty1 transposition protein 103
MTSSSGAASTADIEYDRLTDPNKTTPTPPVHAARLSALLKSLANAEGAVSQSIKARRALVEGLEKILETNKAALAEEETKHAELTKRKAAMEAKKREVEDGIVRGLSSDVSPGLGAAAPAAEPAVSQNGATDPQPHHDAISAPEPPATEDLTPPPIESLTPVGSPRPHAVDHSPPAGPKSHERSVADHPHVSSGSSHPQPLPLPPAPTAGADLLSSLSMPPVRHYAGGSPGAGAGSAFKKRKLEADFSGFGAGEDAMADLDADVAELLRAESGTGH